MKLSPAIENLALRFKKLTARERALVLGAALAIVLVIWNVTLMEPLEARRNALQQELATLQETMGAAADAVEAAQAADPLSVAFARKRALQSELDQLNARLEKEAAGLIEPRHMAEVIHRVLARKPGVTLVSMKNLAAQSLAKDPTQANGPYIHPIELIVEGNYLDVLAYLRALESLPYRFYWRALELKSMEYPINRVRIELGTLSTEREWIGI